MNDENLIFINDELSIPQAEIAFRFSASSGPGGQHANKTATRVTLLFDVAHSPSLTEWQRERLLQELASRLDKDGVLQLHVQESRSQYQNRQTAVSRFQALLAEGLRERKQRRPTKPSQTAKEKRLEEKKKRGERKQERSRDWYDEGS